MARDRDIICVFNGGDPFSTTRKVTDEVDLIPYVAMVNALGFPRKSFQKSCGVDTDVEANVDSLMKEVRAFTGGDLSRIGQVCLLGRSEGCHLALRLAAELNDLGITDLTFVGVSDVPMWDIGRQPPVRKVGAFKPINDPTQAGMTGTPRLFRGSTPLDPSDPASKSIPTVKLDQEIKAKKRVNLFQVQGNHTKYSSSQNRWIWTSGVSDGEVHGIVLGFDENRLRTVTGNRFVKVDESLHINLNTKEHWKQLCRDAATAFADIQ
jgi:hypothetical protein